MLFRSLYVKIVPKPMGGFVSEDDEDMYEVSMARWNYTTEKLTIIPSVQVSSSSDLMNLEAARLVVISTKFSHRPFSFNFDGDDEAMHDEDANNPDHGPRFTVKAATYDFWNLVET